MMNKVLENLLGKSVEQRFEEIEVEEVRARRQAAIEAEMKNKGKEMDDVINEDVEDDEEEEEDDEADKDDTYDVFSASSHDDDDDDQGTSGIKVTETSNEGNVDDYLHDDANEEPDNAGGEGENVDDQNVDEKEKSDIHILWMRLS
ncbi:hypothetical protein Hanom_Chr06g00554701 [Helianthus anomalus]